MKVIKGNRPSLKISSKTIWSIIAICSVFSVIMIGAPNLRLVGASVSSDGSSLAIIEDIQTGKQEVFDLSSKVFGAGEVQDIKDGEVTIRANNGELILRSHAGLRVLESEDNDSQVDNPEQFGVYPIEVAMQKMQAIADGEQVAMLDNDEDSE